MSGTSGGAGFGYIASGTVGTNIIVNITYLDSPATTSSTSYTYQVKTTGGTIYTCVGNSLATMTLMEIAA